MSNDNKTLENVQPGGRVRLQQAPPPEGYAGAWIRSAYGQPSIFTYWNMEVAYSAGWQAALSAQPSPDGQDALHEAARRVISDIDSGDYHGEISEATYAALEAGLAARQPVSETDAYQQGFRDGQDRTCTAVAGQPVEQEPARLPGHTVDGELSVASAIDQVLELFPSSGRAALQTLAGLFTHPTIYRFAAPPAQQPAQVYLDGLDRALGETIDQRDRYHEVADELAARIAAITGVAIGEHSSANCPWQNAIEAAEEYKPAQAVDPVLVRDSIQALLDWIDDWAETPEESGLDPIAERALEVVAQIDAQVYSREPNSEPNQLTVGAQAVDLEQFRPAVCAMGLYAEEPEDVDEAKHLMALIDSQAVRELFWERYNYGWSDSDDSTHG